MFWGFYDLKGFYILTESKRTSDSYIVFRWHLWVNETLPGHYPRPREAGADSGRVRDTVGRNLSLKGRKSQSPCVIL